MIQINNGTPRWIIIIIDFVLNTLALLFAYLMRFDLKANEELFQREWGLLSKSIAFYFLIKVLVFYFFGIHKGLVRFTSTEDLSRIFKAVLTCSIIYFFAGLFRFYCLDGFFLFPMSVLIMEFLASFAFTVGSRFIVKLIYLEATKSKEKKKNVLIYGAGVSGLLTKRTIEKDVLISQKIIGFLDENHKLDGNRLEGVRIYSSDKLEYLHKNIGVDNIILAVQNPNIDLVNNLVETCLNLNISIKKVPRPKSWINGEFSSKQLSEVRIEDLLGRKPISLNQEQISNDLNDQVILVTGAAGSIGSGLVRQIANYSPKKIILLDQSESPLYDLQQELLTNFSDVSFEFVIGDIRNYDRLKRTFDYFRPQFVFHAAAYKHVPLMENNPSEAILTNVRGSKNLVDLALTYEAKKFIMISTDKAVNPTNVMGASKRIAEIYSQIQNNKGKTKFVTTRFGNVLGSNGSVIPLFQRQIQQGGPVTVTDERVTRFFMTIPEACQLVLEAGSMGQGGEIFVFDMGKSVKIIDLAKKMIRLSGLELGKDIELKVIGLRPGEKLYEEVLAKEENTLKTHHPQILIANTREEELAQLDEISELIEMFDGQENIQLVKKMKKIVPEFISNNSEFEKLD